MRPDSPPTWVVFKGMNRKSLVRFRWLLQKDDKTKKMEWNEVAHYILTPGDLSTADRETRQKGFWQVESTSEGKRVYMSCYRCGAVNDFSDHRVGADGFIYPCVVCRACKAHEFVFMDQWTHGERKEIHREQR